MNDILISVGSNIDRTKHIRAARTALESIFAEVQWSRVYESEAVGFNGSRFYNLVVKACTELSIEQVCQRLKAIERENGRKHGEKKFCSRTLDLDLLTYNHVITMQPVVLPREEILFNAFVLQPLAELVPEEVHPVARQTYRQLWCDFDKSSQQLWPILFNWSSS